MGCITHGPKHSVMPRKWNKTQSVFFIVTAAEHIRRKCKRSLNTGLSTQLITNIILYAALRASLRLCVLGTRSVVCFMPWTSRYVCIYYNVIFIQHQHNYLLRLYMRWGTAVAQWLRCCAPNRKVAGSIPAGVIGIFHWHKIPPIALWPWGRLSL